MTKLVLFIHHDSGEKGKAFKRALEYLNINNCPTLLQDFKSFEHHLAKPDGFENDELVVLFADSIDRLDTLSGFINLLEGKRLLLVLPDNHQETISKGHKFWPRFFTHVKDEYRDLCAVIEQIKFKGDQNV